MKVRDSVKPKMKSQVSYSVAVENDALTLSLFLDDGAEVRIAVDTEGAWAMCMSLMTGVMLIKTDNEILTNYLGGSAKVG